LGLPRSNPTPYKRGKDIKMKNLSYDAALVGLLCGVHQEPIRLKVSVEKKEYVLTLRHKQIEKAILVSHGQEERLLPLATLLDEVRPEHLSRSHRRLWALLRSEMKVEIAMYMRQVSLTCLAVEPVPFRALHLLPSYMSGPWLYLMTKHGKVMFLRSVNPPRVFLTLCSAPEWHELWSHTEMGRRETIVYIDGSPEPYAPGTPKSVLDAYLSRELIPLGGRRETVL
jgi:hypothetical protein